MGTINRIAVNRVIYAAKKENPAGSSLSVVVHDKHACGMCCSRPEAARGMYLSKQSGIRFEKLKEI